MTPARFPKFAFFRNPSVAPGMGLGDGLVTIRVLEHPWGPTLWPLGLCSPCHGPPNSFKIAVCRWLNGIWCEHKLPKQFSTLYKSKMENFAKHFLDIVTTYNDERCYVKHVLTPLLCVFHPIWVLWGGGCWGWGGSQGVHEAPHPSSMEARPAFIHFLPPPPPQCWGNRLSSAGGGGGGVGRAPG